MKLGKGRELGRRREKDEIKVEIRPIVSISLSFPVPVFLILANCKSHDRYERHEDTHDRCTVARGAAACS